MPNGALILYAETNPQGCSGEVVRLQRAGTPQILFLGVFSSQEAVQQFFCPLLDVRMNVKPIICGYKT